MEGTLSQELLDFATSSIDSEPEYVKERIEALLEQGADPQYASKESGQTLLHVVAANYGREIADLINDMIGNIDIRDNHGRTPLHTAASTNNSEMVEWLLEHCANLEMKTANEHQTPLHYAARYDSIQAIKILLQAGADLEARDYRSRTPLHVAVDMGRILAADYLISLPTPAEVRVSENNGNMAISAMIKTMPCVAYKALDQLHQIDPSEREESFILSYLEPDAEKISQAVKSPFDTTVLEKRRKILAHPVMQALIDVKWRFIRVYFYLYLAIYILFLLIWSALMSHPTLQEQHIYKFPRDIWRVVLQVVLVILCIMFIVEEILVVSISIIRHVEFLKAYNLKKQEEFATLVLDDKEKAYLKESLVPPSIIPPYLKDIFTIITVVSNFLVFIIICLFVLNIPYYSPTFALWIARIACFATILLWFRVIKYLRAIPSLGTLISVIFEIKWDICRYFLVAAIIFIPYVLSLWLLFGGPQSAHLEDGATKKDLSTFFHVAVMAFRITLIDSYPYDDIRELDEGMTLLLIAPFLLVLAVIGLNLFIALLSNTFQKVQDEALANSLLQRATLISSYEENMFCRRLHMYYYNHIRKNCNPLVKRYKNKDEDIEQLLLQLKDEQSVETKVAGDDGDKILVTLESRVNANINLLKQELIETVKDMLKGSQGEAKEVLSPVAGGYMRSLSHGASTRRRRQPTLREKEWQRKLQSTMRRV